MSLAVNGWKPRTRICAINAWTANVPASQYAIVAPARNLRGQMDAGRRHNQTTPNDKANRTPPGEKTNRTKSLIFSICRVAVRCWIGTEWGWAAARETRCRRVPLPAFEQPRGPRQATPQDVRVRTTSSPRGGSCDATGPASEATLRNSVRETRSG